MQPFSRETIVDRRQPYIRWSAVLAGAAIAAGTWMLLQLLFTGGALTAIDPEEVDRVREFGIGTTVGSLLAPLIAMFVGGLLAGRLASHYDRKVAGLHGVLVWALTTVLGLLITAGAISALTDRSAVGARGAMAMEMPAPGTEEFLEDSVAIANQRLKQQNAPTISVDDLINASNQMIAQGGAGAMDRNVFIEQLDRQTKLSRPEAEAALTAFGDRTPDVIAASAQLATYRGRTLQAANDTGNALLAAGFGLLLCLFAAVAGSIIAARKLPPKNRDYDRPDTVPGTPGAPATAPVEPYQRPVTES